MSCETCAAACPAAKGTRTSGGQGAGVAVALLGQPNSGKSTLFNGLTGARQHVGNWPGKTVERKEGSFRIGDTQCRVVDLPAHGTRGAAEPCARPGRSLPGAVCVGFPRAGRVARPSRERTERRRAGCGRPSMRSGRLCRRPGVAAEKCSHRYKRNRMAREDCAYRWSILDRQTQASLILHGLPDRINKGGVSWLVFSARLESGAVVASRCFSARHFTIGHNHDI